MSHVPGFDHDIFVAFAEEDNAVLPGGSQGWIDEFIDCLAGLLKQTGIPSPGVHAFLQGNLTGAARLSALDRSATVVVVLSPAYLQSDWCQREPARAAMRSILEQRPESLFVVAKADVARELAPEYDNFRRYVFWSAEREISRTLGIPDLRKSGKTDKYYDAAGELADSLAKRLRQLQCPEAPVGRGSGSHGGTGGPAAATRIYLAEATRDVEEDRDKVRRHLEQAGFEVVPRGPLPLGPEQFAAEVSSLIGSCRAFVQLLGDGSCREDESLDRVQQQLEIALRSTDRGLAILQWRSPTLDVFGLRNSRLRDLLLRDTVRAETLNEFFQAVKKAVASPKASAAEPPTVFVDVHREQVGDVHRLFSRYSTVRWDWHEPKATELKRLVGSTHGVVLYWGDGDSGWTQERFWVFVRVFKSQKKNLDRLLIYDGPPESKPKFNGIGFPIAVGRDGNEPDRFRRFLQEIQNAAS